MNCPKANVVAVIEVFFLFRVLQDERSVDKAVDKDFFFIGGYWWFCGRRFCFGWWFWQHNKVIGVDMDVAVAVHFVKQVPEFGTLEGATARAGIIEIVGIARIFRNARDDFLAYGEVIFLLLFFSECRII